MNLESNISILNSLSWIHSNGERFYGRMARQANETKEFFDSMRLYRQKMYNDVRSRLEQGPPVGIPGKVTIPEMKGVFDHIEKGLTGQNKITIFKYCLEAEALVKNYYQRSLGVDSLNEDTKEVLNDHLDTITYKMMKIEQLSKVPDQKDMSI